MGTNSFVNPQVIEGQTFIGSNVQIDGGVAYIRCRFINCNIVFTGTGPIRMEQTTFENPRWSFAGPAANMVSFLRFLYTTGQQNIVELVFETIRTGATQPVTAPVGQEPPQNPSGTIQ